MLVLWADHSPLGPKPVDRLEEEEWVIVDNDDVDTDTAGALVLANNGKNRPHFNFTQVPLSNIPMSHLFFGLS